MKWNKKFEYPTSSRSLINDLRHYDIGNEKLPSVTTILGQTQDPEKKRKLSEWRRKVGEKEADGIRDQAAERGTIMHRIIEGLLLGRRHADLSDLGQAAGIMAQTVYDEGLTGHMDEIWGSEITVHYPGLYAGATDLAGVYEGRESIVDYKQTNKPKKKEWITDYFLQLAGYAMAHNHIHNTKIDTGVILMCSKDNFFQKFTSTGLDFQKHMWGWLGRVDQYWKENYKNTTEDPFKGTSMEGKD